MSADTRGKLDGESTHLVQSGVELVDVGAVRGLERRAHADRVKSRLGEVVAVADAEVDVLHEGVGGLGAFGNAILYDKGEVRPGELAFLEHAVQPFGDGPRRLGPVSLLPEAEDGGLGAPARFEVLVSLGNSDLQVGVVEAHELAPPPRPGVDLAAKEVALVTARLEVIDGLGLLHYALRSLHIKGDLVTVRVALRLEAVPEVLERLRLDSADGVSACLEHLDRHQVVLVAARVVEDRHLDHSAIASSV